MSDELNAGGKMIVYIDEDLEELIPGYLENRQEDLNTLKGALTTGDYETVRCLGHQMKGSGGGYGFDLITEIGKSLEIAGKDSNAQEAQKWLAELANLLEVVEVIYE